MNMMKQKMTGDDCRSQKYDSAERVFRIKAVCLYLSAFGIPFLILGTAFALLGIYPFGNRQVLVVDAWNQYYPFLVEFARKLKNGESLLYCWRLGLGTDFASLLAYYLASPLNLFTVFFPESMLREIFTLFLLIKTGLAGSFCAFALCRMNGSRRYGVLIFSTFYALCGWTIGYYWNTMWLDTFAIFPLTVLGIWLLVREKRCGLYTFSLALSILANYYMGLMVCIFTAVFFFVQCAACGCGIRELWENLKRIVLYSALALMMSAAATLPTLVTLEHAYKSSSGVPRKLTARGWLETLSNFLAFQEPSHQGGRPYLYCGVLCVLLLAAYCRLPRISKREKRAYLAAVLLLFASTNVNLLDYIWHGFHYTNSLPYRFTFLLSFLVVLLAHRAYAEWGTLSRRDCIIIGTAGAGFFFVTAAGLLFQYGKKEGIASLLEAGQTEGNALRSLLLKNALILAAYLTILFLSARRKGQDGKVPASRRTMRILTILLAAAAGAELLPTVFTGTRALWSTDRIGYPDRQAQVRELLEGIEAEENENGFYRVEGTSPFGWNESVLYGYNGVSLFSSTANSAVTETFEQLGLMGWQAANRYHYQNSTPVNNAFLNLKYLIARDGETVNREYLQEIAGAGDVRVYRNEAYLPVGFMVESEMADFDFAGDTPFEIQNDLIKTATGLKEDVFEPLDMIHVGHQNLYVTRKAYGLYHYQPLDDAGQGEEGRFKYNYEMPRDGCAYGFMELRDKAQHTVRVESEGTAHSYAIYNKGTFFPAGTYEKGDIFSVRAEVDAETQGDLRMYVSVFRQDVFDRAYALLEDETLEVTEFTSRSLTGSISVKKENLLYTSVPYEKGWKVYVDGRKADIALTGGVFIGVMLPEGTHTVELRYVPEHVYLALLLSGAGIVLFTGITVWRRKRVQPGR